MADTSRRIIILSGLLIVLVLLSALFFQKTSEIDTYSTKSNIIFRYGISGAEHPNELDTFEGIFTKDMVNKDPVTTKLDLTQEEMDTIYQKMVDISFFSYPKDFKPNLEGEIVEVAPFSFYYLEYIDETRTKMLYGFTPAEKSDANEKWMLLNGYFKSKKTKRINRGRRRGR